MRRGISAMGAAGCTVLFFAGVASARAFGFPIQEITWDGAQKL